MTVTDGNCLRCGKAGKHFRPPTMGKLGYYTCDNK